MAVLVKLIGKNILYKLHTSEPADNLMIKLIVVFPVFLSMALPAYSAQRYLPEFDLYQREKLIHRVKTTVSTKSHTCNRGLSKSYLKLKCNPHQNTKTEQLLSTVDLFSGLRITRKLVGEQPEVSVRYTTLKPRLVQIQALPKDKCENLEPIETSTHEFYSYAATISNNDSRKFGNNMSFGTKFVPSEKTG